MGRDIEPEMKQEAREMLFNTPRRTTAKTKIFAVFLITIITISISASSVSSTSSVAPKSSTATQLQANHSTTIRDAQARSNNGVDGKTLKDQQQEQPTDISSMYVQIPIAEPPSEAEGAQRAQSASADPSSADSTMATSWTGPWPKKFQIGYIKQSDLHQVLLESLKGDSFVSIGANSKSTPAPSSTQTTPTSGAEKNSEQAKPWPQFKQQFQGPSIGLNSKFIYAAGNQRDLLPATLMAQTRHPHHFQQMVNFQRPAGHHRDNQKMISLNNNFHHQNQQFQFAGFPPNMLKNQPVYTINSFPAAGAQQQELAADINQMLRSQHQPSQFQVQSAHSVRPQKSSEYLSSWRPVTSDNQAEQPVSGAGKPVPNDYQSINDGFDEPTLKEGQPMNRHPMLNSYLGSENAAPVQQQQIIEAPGSGKLSPAMISAMKMKEQNKPTKTSSGTKSKSPETSSGTKSTRSSTDSTSLLSGSRRQNNGTASTSSTASSRSASADGSTTPMSADNNSTTVSPSTTTLAATTASSLDAETTESDVESVDTDPTTTTESDSTVSSTTVASVGEEQANSSTSSTTSATSQDADEVVTQSLAGGQSSVPFAGSDAESTTQRSSTTTVSSREETTPRKESQDSSSSTSTVGPQETKSGEVEGTKKQSKLDSMSDEALLAAAVQTASEIGKTSGAAMNLAKQRSSQPAAKKARSSERLVRQKTEVGGKKATVSSKPAAKRAANQSTNRSAKQVGAVKSQSLKSGADKKRSSQLSEKPKKTRMAAQGERLQQVVSMTAAQAQSTAQTLASLLLSRCMSSAGCSHLLDVCTTKQAMVPMPGQEGAEPAGNWSMPIGLVSSSVMSLAAALQADKALKLFPQWKEAIENLVDIQDAASSSGYTLILPSNEAVERLSAAQIDHWQANLEQLARLIDNHLLETAESVDFGASNSPKTSVIRSKGLQVNQHRDKMVTINGKRLIYANQAAPANGRIHVIDGLLDSGSGAGKLLDIMDTLKQCDKFDGFVTLAEGTGLFQLLKQDGPMTVFVPSNEALRKIPDEELDVIKNNNTALKEFLMYHVVNGSYFSQDLRDGQQLATILDMKPIQVGVRVDGCSRRLVEANTSPMRRPDIVAKNGVIHILDWYLTVRDNDWCDGSVSSSSQTTSPPAAVNSERLQQVASDSNASYATRMTLPANHKPLSEASMATQAINQKGSSLVQTNPMSSSNSASAQQQASTLETNNIIITATALSDSAKAA